LARSNSTSRAAWRVAWCARALANLTAEARQHGLAVRQQNAREHQANKQASRVATLLQAQGHNLTQIAHELNEAGYRTRRGKAFYLATVSRLLVRAAMKPVQPTSQMLANPVGEV